MFKIQNWKINRISKKIKAMQSNRQNNQPGDEVIKKEIGYYYDLIKLFKKLKGNKKCPFANILLIECYRAAANLEDAAAHFHLAKMFIDEAQYRQHIQAEGIFKSAANLHRSETLYQEAHAHLEAAEKLGNIDAQRLKGLCLINGWGVFSDKERGFDLVVKSIEKEGSWDKVPEIFAEMGLNKPEFFSAIMQRRK